MFQIIELWEYILNKIYRPWETRVEDNNTSGQSNSSFPLIKEIL